MNARLQPLVDQFLKLLEEEADEKYRQQSVKTTPSKLKIIGVKVPVLREIVREWLSKNKEMGRVEFLKLLNVLWHQQFFEMRNLALELLWANKKVLNKFDWQIAESWLKEIDNWAHADFLSVNIFGFLVAQDQFHLPKLKAHLKSPNKWFRRAGVVSLIPLIRTKEIDAKEVLSRVDQIVDDKDPMIQKAVSWVLRELVRAGSREEVEKYLTQNQSRLVKYVICEVNNKLRTGLKSGKTKL